MALISRSMKARLQAIDKRVEHINLFVVTEKQVGVAMVTDRRGSSVPSVTKILLKQWATFAVNTALIYSLDSGGDLMEEEIKGIF